MTIENYIFQLKDKVSVHFHEPLPFSEIKRALTNNGLLLPQAHVLLLKITDGLECYGGYFRLFGLSDKRKINLLSWNAEGLWKFSWGGRIQSFLCFGETAWGDQYAYRLNDAGEISSAEVYFIENLAMEPEIIASNFYSFFINEILPNSSDPYDAVLVDVRANLGDLSVDEHIVYMPSPLLGGREDPSNVQKMDAVTSMVVGGDLYVQLASEFQDRPIKELQPYIDETGRNRIKVVWLNN